MSSLSRKLQWSLVIITLLLGSSALLVVHAETTTNGQWMIEPCPNQPGLVQLTLHYNERGEQERNDGWGWRGNTMTHREAMTALSGLSEADMNSAGTHVKFRIVHDAGALQSEGWFAGGKGSGHFDYVADPQFTAELKKRGFDAPTENEQFKLTMADFKLELLDELKQQGYEPFDVHKLVRLANHGVNTAYVRNMKAAGYKFDRVDTLIKLRDHGVDREYVDGLAAAGFKDLPAADLLKARDHGVGPEFIAEWKELGYTSADLYNLIKLRDHGVDGRYAREMADAGLKGLSPMELARLRDHGVDASFAREVRATVPNADASDLVRLRDHGVSASLVRQHKDLSLNEIIRLRDRGTDY